MNIRQLVSHIAKQEGKKHEASVGDVREIVSIISDVIYKNPFIGVEIYANGARRVRRKKR